jgi:hypothetical protein
VEGVDEGAQLILVEILFILKKTPLDESVNK